jgi:hypothetical protein
MLAFGGLWALSTIKHRMDVAALNAPASPVAAPSAGFSEPNYTLSTPSPAATSSASAAASSISVKTSSFKGEKGMSVTYQSAAESHTGKRRYFKTQVGQMPEEISAADFAEAGKK